MSKYYFTLNLGHFENFKWISEKAKKPFFACFLQKINEYTHEFKKLIRAHQVLIISYQTPRKIMESVENCEFRGSGKLFFKSGAKFLETPIWAYLLLCGNYF